MPSPSPMAGGSADASDPSTKQEEVESPLLAGEEFWVFEVLQEKFELGKERGRGVWDRRAWLWRRRGNQGSPCWRLDHASPRLRYPSQSESRKQDAEPFIGVLRDARRILPLWYWSTGK